VAEAVEAVTTPTDEVETLPVKPTVMAGETFPGVALTVRPDKARLMDAVRMPCVAVAELLVSATPVAGAT